MLLNVEFRVNFNVFLLYTYSYATNLRRCLLAEIGARRIGMSIKARRWMKVRFRRKEIMYENEWLRLSRCYFMEYKKLASDIIHKDAQYYLIVYTPEHMKEIESLVKGKVNCSIFCISRVPLQWTPKIDSKYESLFNVLDHGVYQEYHLFNHHSSEDANKFEQALLYDFKNRLLKTEMDQQQAIVVACSEFSEVYVKELKDEMKFNVNQWETFKRNYL